MKLVVGLGNPGLQYEMTRHNVGFQVVDLLCTGAGTVLRYESKYKGKFAKTRFKNQDLIFLKPETYMNLSGEAVRAIANYLKIDSHDILAIHDDVSLILGRVKVQQAGGAGGQHGIESIIECLGKNTFDRLKVGVGPDPGGARRASYVLSRVAPEDEDLYRKSLNLAAEAANSWILNGTLETANRFNGINLAQPLSEKPKVRPPSLQESEALAALEHAVSVFLNEKSVAMKTHDVLKNLIRRQPIAGVDADEIKVFTQECLRGLPERFKIHEQRWKKLIEARLSDEGV
jgi:PTH1 family peptidyl-tRNA hydrolase